MSTGDAAHDGPGASPDPFADQHQLRLCLLAFSVACDRLDCAFGSEERTYAAAGEVLFWAVACDEGFDSLLEGDYRSARNKDAAGRYLLGMRWARNRMTHQRALLVVHNYGAQLDSAVLDKAVIDTVDHLKWASAADVTQDARYDFGRPEYERLMEGRPISSAIESARSWLISKALNELSHQHGWTVGDLPRVFKDEGPT